MTIRFTCAGCGSLLKIKDDLAGTDGKCPKCKTEFVVPDLASDDDSSDRVPVVASESAGAHEKHDNPKNSADKPTETPAVKTVAKAKKLAGAGDDFDPADFLMGDGPRSSTPAFEDIEPDEEPARRNTNVSPSKKPSSKSSIPTAAPTPGAGSGISASAHAKEMMMKAMDESRAHAGDAPEEEKRPGFDFAGFFREFGLKGGAAVLFGIILTCGLYMFFDRMMGSRLKLPPLGYVTGIVSLDGTPLAGATIYFAPLEPGMADAKKERTRTSMAITDDKGHYKMIYIESTEGVAIGKCRVWLDLVTPKGQAIPPNFSEATLMVREVKSGKNEFPFDMKSNP